MGHLDKNKILGFFEVGLSVFSTDRKNAYSTLIDEGVDFYKAASSRIEYNNRRM